MLISLQNKKDQTRSIQLTFIDGNNYKDKNFATEIYILLQFLISFFKKFPVLLIPHLNNIIE